MSEWCRNYRIVNGVLAGWLVFFILLPWISIPMGKYFPRIWRCSYRAMTGENCPFCGLTRDLRTLVSGETTFLNPAALWVVVIVAALLLWRVVCHFAAAHLTPTGLRSWIVLDAVVTAGWLSVLAIRIFLVWR